MKRTLIQALPLAGAIAALLAPAALAAPDRTGALSAAATSFKWTGAATTAFNQLFDETDPAASCGKTPADYCEMTLLQLDGSGALKIQIPAPADPVSDDVDLYVYASDATGKAGKELGFSFNIGDAESVSVPQTAGYVLVVTPYLNTLEAGYDATATFTPESSGSGTDNTPTPAPTMPPPTTPPPPPSSPPPSAQPAPQDLTPATTIAKLPARVKAKKLKGFKGTASDDKGVGKVEVALTYLRKGKCSSLSARGTFARTPKKGSRCVPTTFLPAKGTTTWTFQLRKRLKKGSYTLWTRATDSAGQSEAGFNARNARSFKVI